MMEEKRGRDEIKIIKKEKIREEKGAGGRQEANFSFHPNYTVILFFNIITTTRKREG